MARILIGLALLAASTLNVAASDLSQTQLRREIIDRPLAYSGPGNQNGVIVYRQNKELVIRTQEGLRDSGTWGWRGNAICTRLRSRGGNKDCFTLAKVERDAYITSHGFRVIPVK